MIGNCRNLCFSVVLLLLTACASEPVSGPDYAGSASGQEPAESVSGPEPAESPAVHEGTDPLGPESQPSLNAPPTARIEAPCDGLILYEFSPSYFWGSAWDDEDGELSHESFDWSVNGQPLPGCGEWDGWAEAGCGDGGYIGSWALGPNVLTLTVTDSDGAQGSASITITGIEFRDASFTDDILSFMLTYCENCHGAERAEAGIRLDSYEAIMTGATANGPLIVEGDPTGGILIPQILSDHYHVEGFGLYPSKWLGETILPIWILEGARNTDHAHPPIPGPCN
jgi:hypothetical protein